MKPSTRTVLDHMNAELRRLDLDAMAPTRRLVRALRAVGPRHAAGCAGEPCGCGWSEVEQAVRK